MDIVDPGFAAPVLDNVDLDRAVELVRQVCRIPSVLGNEGELAAFVALVMGESGFEAVDLQPAVPGRPNAIGEVSFGPGRRVVLTGHTDDAPRPGGMGTRIVFVHPAAVPGLLIGLAGSSPGGHGGPDDPVAEGA